LEFDRRTKLRTQINIAPLIDVVFLLLIFFMLSSQFIARSGIRVSLPRASTAESHPGEETIVSITEDGSLYLNGKDVTLEDLLDKLKAEVAESEEKTLIISADEKIDLGLAVKVMDIAREANVQGLVISTEMEQRNAGAL
jgi:biopolymer transport protein ExbD